MRRLHDGTRCSICGALFEHGDEICRVQTSLEVSRYPVLNACGDLVVMSSHKHCLESEVSH